jgi:hypothetical protein
VIRLLDADRRAHGDEWWKGTKSPGSNKSTSTSQYETKQEARHIKKQAWRKRRKLEDEAKEMGVDLHDKRTWPRCAGCQVTLALKHARKADRCVSCINRDGNYYTFYRAVQQGLDGSSPGSDGEPF